MFCINCFHENTSVTNSRPHKKQPLVWRRRTCKVCRHSFTTLERPSLASSIAVRRTDGAIAPFNLGQLIISIAEAFHHDQTTGKTAALWLAQTVETHLATERNNISTDDIEAVTHSVLKAFDELAALQYAAKQQLIVSAKRRGRPSVVSRAEPMPQSPSL